MEFVFVVAFIFMPILAGLATVGMSMVTAGQVASLNTTAGQMFASAVDFTQAENQNILLKIAGSLNTSTSGGGVVILSEIDGTSGGDVCSNQVIIPIGTGGAGSSLYAPGMAVSPAFTALMPGMEVGQVAYVAETYYNNPNMTWALAPAGTASGIYVKAVF